jgi:cell division protease FtsH
LFLIHFMALETINVRYLKNVRVSNHLRVMKSWSRKIVKLLKKKTPYLVCIGLTTLAILILAVGQSSETYTVDRLLSVAKGNEAQYTLVSGAAGTDQKTYTFVVRPPHWTVFNQADLIIDSTNYTSAYDKLSKAGIQFESEHSFWSNVKYRPMVALLYLLATFALPLALQIMFSQSNNSAGPVRYTSGNSYGNPPASKEEEKTKLTFDDVAGIDEVKEQIQEIVDLFKDSSKIIEMGGKIPKGVLLNGPPGTGKTLLAKVTASQCEANFIHSSGSDFVEMYVGVGAKRVRDLFDKARQCAPCILFIDEIDAVAGRRGVDNNSEREQTLNQILVEMDGFDGTENILIFAATNQMDKLDPAILRPGRFDRRIEVHLPDEVGRAKILDVYLKKSKKDNSINALDIARATSGFSGADLENLVNEAILFAAKQKKNKISQSDLLISKDKILMGAERRIKMNEADMIQTAYHEIGHAFICNHLNLAKLVNISIVPRGKALGVTQMESEDMLTLKHETAVNQLAMMMGGRVAEKIFFDHYSTGAQNDLQRAWVLTRNLVAHWGMSDLGPIALDEVSYRMISERTRHQIDQQIIRTIKESEALAESILNKNRDKIKFLADQLFIKQTITAKEFEKLMSNSPFFAPQKFKV